MSKTKLEIVKDSITQVGVPAMLDEVLEGCEVRPTPYTLEVTESGEYSVKAEDIDAEERQEQGLTPWDGLSQVNVNVDVPAGDIESFEGVQQASSLSGLADFANRCACVGALLSYDNGTFTIWNGDSTAADYWDPQATETSTPSDQYGTVIAVCSGKGLWVAKDGVSHDSLMFAPSDTDLYLYSLNSCVIGSGWDNTQHILNNYYNGNESDYEITIWEWLKEVETDNSILANHLFIPNAEELRKVCFNTMDDVYTGSDEGGGGSQIFSYSRNIGAFLGLFGNSFWSSSQYYEEYTSVFYVDLSNGKVGSVSKADECNSLALLHF